MLRFRRNFGCPETLAESNQKWKNHVKKNTGPPSAIVDRCMYVCEHMWSEKQREATKTRVRFLFFLYHELEQTCREPARNVTSSSFCSMLVYW